MRYRPYIWMAEDEPDAHVRDWESLEAAKRREEFLAGAQGGKLLPLSDFTLASLQYYSAGILWQSQLTNVTPTANGVVRQDIMNSLLNRGATNPFL